MKRLQIYLPLHLQANPALHYYQHPPMNNKDFQKISYRYIGKGLVYAIPQLDGQVLSEETFLEKLQIQVMEEIWK